MARRLSDEAIRYLSSFEEIADVEAIDCVIDEERNRVAIVVGVGQLAEAIGPDGQVVRRAQSRFDRELSLVEMADTPEEFVANALRPAAVYDVDIVDRNGTQIAMVDVADNDRGAAIGTGGRTIELARHLAGRLFDIDDVELR